MPSFWRDVPFQWVPFQARLRAALRDAGSFAIQNVSATGTITLNGSPTLVLVDTSSGNVTLTLPAPSTVEGFRLEVKKMVAANTLTLSSSDGIDGVTTLTWTTQYQSYALIAGAGVWNVV